MSTHFPSPRDKVKGQERQRLTLMLRSQTQHQTHMLRIQAPNPRRKSAVTVEETIRIHETKTAQLWERLATIARRKTTSLKSAEPNGERKRMHLTLTISVISLKIIKKATAVKTMHAFLAITLQKPAPSSRGYLLTSTEKRSPLL